MLSKQSVHIPLVGGLNSKAHPFALDPPQLAVAENILFDEPGALLKRWGHAEPTTRAATNPLSALTAGKGVSNSVFVTASISVKPGQILVLWVHSVGIGQTLIVSVDSGLTAAGVKFEGIAGGGGDYKTSGAGDPETGVTRWHIDSYRAVAKEEGSGTITLTFSQSKTAVQWGVEAWDGADTSGSNGSGAIAQAVFDGGGDGVLSRSLTMAAYQDGVLSGGVLVSSSGVSVGFGRDTGTGSFTPEAGWGKLHDQIESGVAQLQTIRANGPDDLTPSASWSTSSFVGVVGLEIKAAKGGTAIVGGGHITDIKAYPRRADELLVIATNDMRTENGQRVFSWSPSLSQWRDQGPFTPCKVTEAEVIEKIANQSSNDAAWYISGSKRVVVRAWSESTSRFQVFDDITGAPLCAEQDLGTSKQVFRCLCVGTKLHVYYEDHLAGFIKARIIDPLDVANTVNDTAVTVSGIIAASGLVKGDACLKGAFGATSALLVYSNDVSGYGVRVISETGSVTASADKARVANDKAIAYEPNTDRIIVARVDGANVLRGDLLNGSSLADVTVNVNMYTGTALEHVAAAFRTVTEIDAVNNYRYRCYVWVFDRKNISLAADVVICKYINTDAVTGAITGPSGSTNWLIHAKTASRAVALDDGVYVGVHGAPDSDLKQLCWYLYRNDGQLIARAIVDRFFIGGLLPQIQTLGGDVYGVQLGYQRPTSVLGTFADKGLMDVRLDFASAAPYQGAQLGKALYFPGGILLSYDGVGASESGFLNAPKVTVSAGVAGGSLSAGTYTWLVIPEWYNAQGELELGTYYASISQTVSGSQKVTLTVYTLTHTLKRTRKIGFGIYRNLVNGGAVYFRVSELNPDDNTDPNKYVFNDLTQDFVTMEDAMSDATLATKPPLYLNSGELDHVAPGPSSVIAQGQNRIFIAGGVDTDRVRFSKLWDVDEGVAFNDALEMKVPQDGGEITAIHATDTGFIVFKERRIYHVQGVGPDDLGSGVYGDPQLIADVGCSDARTVALTPLGVFFFSARGWRLLMSGLEVRDIGAAVSDYNSQTFVAVLPLEKRNLVLCVAAGGKTLAYDYFVNQWSTWSEPVGFAAALYDDGYVYTTDGTTHISDQIGGSSATKLDTSAGTRKLEYHRDVELPWAYFANMIGFGRCWRISLLGEYVGLHRMRVRIWYDNVYGSPVEDRYWTVDASNYEVEVNPGRQKGRAIKVRFTDAAPASPTELVTDTSKLVAVSYLLGVKVGLTRQPSTRKV